MGKKRKSFSEHKTDGDMWDWFRSIEREALEEIGDKEALAQFDEEERQLSEEDED